MLPPVFNLTGGSPADIDDKFVETLKDTNTPQCL